MDYRDLDKNNKSENKLIAYNPSDSAYCIFTSGSSGFPKGILLTYEGILNHIDAKISLLNLTSESRLCLSFNIGFVASIWQILTPALLYLKIILRGTAANGTFPIVPVFNQSFRQNGSKFQYPILSYHSRLSSTDGLRFSQSAHSKVGR